MTDCERNELGQAVGPLVKDWRVPAAPKKAVIAGIYCQLEPLDPDHHGEALFESNRRDAAGRMWTYLSYGPFETLADYEAWIWQTCLGADPLFFAIVDHATGKAAGVASYLRIARDSGSIEVGHLAYSPLLQQTRAATEAMYLMMRNAFELGYRRYEWKCHALNEASRNAALRLGFRYEGTFRQALVMKGRNRDTAWFSIIDSEWPALARAYTQWLDESNFDAAGRQRQSLRKFIAASREDTTE